MPADLSTSLVSAQPLDESRRRTNATIGFVTVLIALIIVGAVSTYSLFVVLVDGWTALFVVTPPILAGLWAVPLLRLGKVPLRWHFLLGAAMGLGGISLAVLGLGLVGVLHRSVWLGIYAALCVAGAIRLAILLSRELYRDPQPQLRSGLSIGHLRWWWLGTAVFLALALLAASQAPGYIWSEEGFGYDVLEYHLQVPKEYHEAGRISYLPHNVYANFPMQVEMLYLLAMVFTADPLEVGAVANLIHLIVALLAVFASWVAGLEFSRRCGFVAAIAVATTGWLSYLSGLAYVENATLFFGMTSMAAMLRARLHPGDPDTASSKRASRSLTWAGVAGAIAGFAGGCKYTALPMIALPIAVASMISPLSRGIDVKRPSVFLLCCVAAVSPWLVKNLNFTGNPMFPLAHEPFRSNPPGWGEEQALRWSSGHEFVASSEQASPSATHLTIVDRVRALFDVVFRDRFHRLPAALTLVALLGLLGRRMTRDDAWLLTILAAQVVVWMFATHLYARFAVVFLLPIALLAGRAIPASAMRLRLASVSAALVLGAAWSGIAMGRLYQAEAQAIAPASWIYDGELPGFEFFQPLNNPWQDGDRLLLVGEARAFYFRMPLDYFVVFNRNPFAEAVAEAQLSRDAARNTLNWLRERGYTHVLVNWVEVARLRRTYGFSELITRKLFEDLCAAGLVRTHSFPLPDQSGVHVEIFRVPQAPPSSPKTHGHELGPSNG